MKNQADTNHTVYQTRRFTLALATSALTPTEIIQLEQRSGMSLAQLTSLQVSVLASLPTDAIATTPTLTETLTPQADNTEASAANADADACINSNGNSNRPLVDAEDSRHAQDFNAHRRARASVNAAPRLYLSYFIHQPLLEQPMDSGRLAKQLGWQAWQPQQVAFCDYLWEHTCLECFIAGAASEYVEINASPVGPYAIYHFSDYRQPATLPPPPLYRGSSLAIDKQPLADRQRAHIDWQSDMLRTLNADESAYPLANSLSRHFSLDLSQLPVTLLPLTQLHPCVILMLGEIPLYYAPQHAQPADFHNRAHWQPL